jgi:hypothetical protein
MFAEWIPDVLKRIEDLHTTPNPPTGLAVAGARVAVVNKSLDFPPPDVAVWTTPTGNGIVLTWNGASIRIFPSGRAMHFG